MRDVLPCPICWSQDVIQERESGDCQIEYWKEYECFSCGDNAPTFRTKESWNQYAAAVALAKAMVKVQKVYHMPLIKIEGQLSDAIKTEDDAKERVMEVFK